jgi:multiple sugar transport system substrate-binding protein
VDPKTNKAVVNSEPWKQYFELYKQIREIPGNAASGDLVNRFFVNQNVGMTLTYGGTFGNSEQWHSEGKDMSFWDVVTFPLQSGSGVKGIETEARLLMLSTTSKHPETAFKVMNYLVSQEVQEMVARRGQMSSLNDTRTKELFAADLASLKGKNYQAAFKNVYNANPTPTPYDKTVEAIVDKAMNTWVLKENKDVNTALRQAEEAANKEIASMMK